MVDSGGKAPAVSAFQKGLGWGENSFVEGLYFDIQGRSMPWFHVGGIERNESNIAGRRQLQKGLKIKSEEVQNENAETGLHEKLTYFQRF